MDAAHIIASLLGPVMLAIAVSEAVNLRIWSDQPSPQHVQLNGMILFAVGLAVLRFHAGWRADWTALVTLTGWLLLIGGAARMMFPAAKQASAGPAAWIAMGVTGALGCVFSVAGWL